MAIMFTEEWMMNFLLVNKGLTVYMIFSFSPGMYPRSDRQCGCQNTGWRVEALEGVSKVRETF